jgi:hypothetical protein
MALVTSLQFSEKSGALCVDQESWHLLRRKTFFADSIYSLVSGEIADRTGLEIIYAGVGHPSYHLEVATGAEKAIARRCSGEPPGQPESTQIDAKEVAEIVLEVFRQVHRRRISDKLHYTYGFDADDFIEREGKAGNGAYPIKQETVLRHARNVLEGKESVGYPPLPPAVEACLIGIDRVYGFSGFTLKESDGVLSFHSCQFDALGYGRYVAGASFAKLFNDKFLDSRRRGTGKQLGLYQIINAMIEGMDHSGQVGGNIRLVMLDGEGRNREERVRVLSRDPARLSIEIVRASRGGLLEKEKAVEHLARLIDEEAGWEEIERDLFAGCPDPGKLEKLLRGYKIGEGNLPASSVVEELFRTKEEPKR